MTPITAREIFLAYTGVHNTPDGKPQMYVTIEEHEALRQKRLELGETVSRLMEDNYSLVAGLARVSDDNEKLKDILQRWATVAPTLCDDCNYAEVSTELEQLIADTQEVLK